MKVENRVFFGNEKEALSLGYRPCGQCMPDKYKEWKPKQTLTVHAPLPLAWWVGKDDILRHSYGTYRAAILRNSHNLAEETGNSVTMVRTYYDAVVSPSVAKLWWKIRPAKPKNLIPMKAAA